MPQNLDCPIIIENEQYYERTCCSYGIKAMLISFNVFMYLATLLRDNSSKSASGHAANKNYNANKK